MNFLFIRPWNYHDEGIKYHNLSLEWRNGPYSLLLLATLLRNKAHRVKILDLEESLIRFRGRVSNCLDFVRQEIEYLKPDIIGISFFSVQFLEAAKIVDVCRRTIEKEKIKTIIIGGGIHSSVEPNSVVNEIKCDFAFCGEGEDGLLRLAGGQDPVTIDGIYYKGMKSQTKGKYIGKLDDLPFPDWNLCNYLFYTNVGRNKRGIFKAGSLDIIMGRGCVNRCSFCAYNNLSPVKFYSEDYLIEQIKYMIREFNTKCLYFLDSSLGNNKQLLIRLCEEMIKKGIAKKIEWYGNMRADQVDENLLKLMWKAGCRFLFYGFESGSQRILDFLNKKTTVEDNYRAALLHQKLRFPYNASMLINVPNEQEDDIRLSFEFVDKVRPPALYFNWYVPLPGSYDYEKLKAAGYKVDDPYLWRKFGESSPSDLFFSGIPRDRLEKLLVEGKNREKAVEMWDVRKRYFDWRSRLQIAFHNKIERSLRFFTR
ncbi:TPA: B12-binding domain-containing radical SAM protein [bacterium]|nr:B12-binding domain-containing radical SAM protein [bacterium]